MGYRAGAWPGGCGDGLQGRGLAAGPGLCCEARTRLSCGAEGSAGSWAMLWGWDCAVGPGAGVTMLGLPDCSSSSQPLSQAPKHKTHCI